MFYLIYKTTHIETGKCYIGAHQTTNIDDGYLGSGKYLKRAILKYGLESFKKEILHIFDNKEDMFEKERELVDEEFISETNTYNLKIGGSGGFTSEEAKKGRIITNQKLQEKYGKNFNIEIGKLGALSSLNTRLNLLKSDSIYREKTLKGLVFGRIASHTKEANQKRKDTMKVNGHSKGEKNNQFGKMWIYNIETLESKTILKTDTIPISWNKGRKMK